MYSMKEVANWLMTAPEGNVAASIVCGATHELPGDLGRFVMLLDSERYIHAMWKRTLDSEARPVWTWHLYRRAKKADRLVVNAMIQHSAIRPTEVVCD